MPLKPFNILRAESQHTDTETFALGCVYLCYKVIHTKQSSLGLFNDALSTAFVLWD